MAKSRWVVLIAALAALVLAACGGDEGEAESSEPIKIGASLPLTGDLSQPGKEAQRGYEVWQDLVNDQGGLLGRPVELIIRDDGSDQNTIVADYNNLISRENVDLLLGTFSSFLNLPASAVAERNQMVYVEPAGGSPEMFSRGFEFLFLSQQNVAVQQADGLAAWVESLPEAERPETAAYVSLDDPFTEPVISRLRGALEDLGVETVFTEVYPQGTQSFDTVANQVKESNADLVANGATSLTDGGGFIRSLNKVGFSPERFFQTEAPSLEDEFAKAIGEGSTDGIFYPSSYHLSLETEGNQEFLDAYRERFDKDPGEDAADAFAAAQILQKAVEAVGEIDQVKIKDWLHENTVETILGPLSWDEAGRPQSQYLLVQWQGGETEVISPEELATTDDVVDPKPPWK